MAEETNNTAGATIAPAAAPAPGAGVETLPGANFKIEGPVTGVITNAAKTVLVDGKTVSVKFGVNIPDMKKTFTVDELLAKPEAVAYLLEVGSGAVEIIKQEVI